MRPHHWHPTPLSDECDLVIATYHRYATLHLSAHASQVYQDVLVGMADIYQV